MDLALLAREVQTPLTLSDHRTCCNRAVLPAPASLLWQPGLLSGLIVEHRLWCKVDPVAVGESQAFDTCALVDDPVDALSIVDDTGVLLIANACVQTCGTVICHD